MRSRGGRGPATGSYRIHRERAADPNLVQRDLTRRIELMLRDWRADNKPIPPGELLEVEEHALRGTGGDDPAVQAKAERLLPASLRPSIIDGAQAILDDPSPVSTRALLREIARQLPWTTEDEQDEVAVRAAVPMAWANSRPGDAFEGSRVVRLNFAVEAAFEETVLARLQRAMSEDAPYMLRWERGRLHWEPSGLESKLRFAGPKRTKLGEAKAGRIVTEPVKPTFLEWHLAADPVRPPFEALTIAASLRRARRIGAICLGRWAGAQMLALRRPNSTVWATSENAPTTFVDPPEDGFDLTVVNVPEARKLEFVRSIRVEPDRPMEADEADGEPGEMLPVAAWLGNYQVPDHFTSSSGPVPAAGMNLTDLPYVPTKADLRHEGRTRRKLLTHGRLRALRERESTDPLGHVARFVQAGIERTGVDGLLVILGALPHGLHHHANAVVAKTGRFEPYRGKKLPDTYARPFLFDYDLPAVEGSVEAVQVEDDDPDAFPAGVLDDEFGFGCEELYEGEDAEDIAAGGDGGHGHDHGQGEGVDVANEAVVDGGAAGRGNHARPDHEEPGGPDELSAPWGCLAPTGRMMTVWRRVR